MRGCEILSWWSCWKVMVLERCAATETIKVLLWLAGILFHLVSVFGSCDVDGDVIVVAHDVSRLLLGVVRFLVHRLDGLFFVRFFRWRVCCIAVIRLHNLGRKLTREEKAGYIFE